MKRQSGILAEILTGTALGLLMASTPLAAFPLAGGTSLSPRTTHGPLMLAQAECAEGESAEACAARQQPAPAEPKQAEPKQAEPEQAAPEPAPAEPAPQPQPQPQPQAEQPAPEPQQQAPAAEPAPQPEPEQPAPVPEPAPEPEQPAQPQAEQPAQQAPAPKRKAQKPQAAPQAEQPAQQGEQAPAGQQPAESAPAESAPVESTPAQPAPAEKAAEPQTKKQKLRDFLKKKQSGEETKGKHDNAGEGAPDSAAQPAPDAGTEKAAPAEEQAPGDATEPAPAGQPAQGEGQAQPQLPQDTQEQALPKADPNAAQLPENAAPLPDSAKGRGGKRHGEGQDRGEKPDAGAQQTETGQAEPKPVPKSDSAAQDLLEQIGKIQSVEAERGKRIDRNDWQKDRRRHREERRERDGGDLLKEDGDRIVIRFGDNIYVDNRDSNRRLERNARDSYVEELPRGFTRYTIVRDNGVRVVTIRNADGDIVRRSRIGADNREAVLYYVPEDDYGRIRGGYRDAGADLPPLRLTIPASEYILDAQRAEPDDYYTYLDAPPVERVERIYSVDEVVHSARIRDKVRRIDLDTITFDTGSAEIGEDQVNSLEALGEAMNRILKENPAETFLIEGHTDAVGSDESNLVLSDQRAESVAEALTSVFDIPPENLTTQGYGEQYLKLDTQGASRENRRVAIRRITPLVAPVARR